MAGRVDGGAKSGIPVSMSTCWETVVFPVEEGIVEGILSAVAVVDCRIAVFDRSVASVLGSILLAML